VCSTARDYDTSKLVAIEKVNPTVDQTRVDTVQDTVQEQTGEKKEDTHKNVLNKQREQLKKIALPSVVKEKKKKKKKKKTIELVNAASPLMCTKCGAVATEELVLKECTCGCAWYCPGGVCQKGDWKTHKKVHKEKCQETKKKNKTKASLGEEKKKKEKPEEPEVKQAGKDELQMPPPPAAAPVPSPATVPSPPSPPPASSVLQAALLPGTSAELKEQGNQAFRSKEYEQALRCYTSALKTDASNVALFGNLAMAYLHCKKYQLCIDACK
tara:strand:+ start:706 stop:1515 length:810 start_codon:yes stop_codon:yes gene_type:complete